MSEESSTPSAKARAKPKAKDGATSPGLLWSATTALDWATHTACVRRPWARARESQEPRCVTIAKAKVTASKAVRARAVVATPTRASTKEEEEEEEDNGLKANVKGSGTKAEVEKARAGAKAREKEFMA